MKINLNNKENKPSNLISTQQFKDKITFTISICMLTFLPLVIFNKLQIYPYINAGSILILIFFRIKDFIFYKWQFYFFDLCYLVNAIVIVYSLF